MIAAEQARAFCLMALCGAGCACTHDAARLLGWVLGGRGGFVMLMDLLLGAWLAAGMTAAGLALGMNPMRLYLFAGVMLGTLLWYGAAGWPARRFGRHLAGRFGAE